MYIHMYTYTHHKNKSKQHLTTATEKITLTLTMKKKIGSTLDARCRARAIHRSAPQRSPVSDSDTDP